MNDYPSMIIVAFLSFGTLIFVLKLLSYHFILISKSITTYEDLKGIYKDYLNKPFKKTCSKSWLFLLCTRKTHTFFSFTGKTEYKPVTKEEKMHNLNSIILTQTYSNNSKLIINKDKMDKAQR